MGGLADDLGKLLMATGTTVLSFPLGSPAFFDRLWQFRRTRPPAELQNDYFLDAAVMAFSHPLFLL